MFTYKGIHLFTAAEAERHHIRTLDLPQYVDLHVAADTEYGQFYKLYVKVYDSAVPQAWFEEQHRRTGEWPLAVWSYDEPHSMFGGPVFFKDVLYRFGKDAVQAIVSGEIRFEELP